MAVRPYGEHWRAERRLFHSQAHQNAAPKFRGVQLRQARMLLKQLVEDPGAVMQRVHGCGLLLSVSQRIKLMEVCRCVGTMIMDIVYGVEIPDSHRYIKRANKLVQLFSDASLDGPYIVDFFPFCESQTSLLTPK